MGKYVCSVCGYVYDEAKGIPEASIAPGTSWESVPDDWACPLCGATKSEFAKEGESEAKENKPLPVVESFEDMKELSTLEVSALCTNLARGCEKQYKHEEAVLFTELADYFKAISAPSKIQIMKSFWLLLKKILNRDFQTPEPFQQNQEIEVH